MNSLRKVLGFVTHDIKNKLIALFFALIIWYFAWNNQIRTSERESVAFKVQIHNIAAKNEDWYIIKKFTSMPGAADKPFTDYIELALKGPQRDLQNVNWKDIKGFLYIDPDQCRKMEGYMLGQDRITAANFTLPNRSLKVVEESITPNVIHFRICRMEERSIPVHIKPDNIIGRPPSPYRLSMKRKIEVKPERFYVKGPAFFLGKLELATEDLHLFDIEPEGFSSTVAVPLRIISTEKEKIDLVDKNGTVLDEDRQTVQVTFYFESEPKITICEQVNLWAKTPYSGKEGGAVAVVWEPARLWVNFKGTKQDLAVIEKHKKEHDFGLHFVVDPAAKKGTPYSVSLPDLKRDFSQIPENVDLEPVQDAAGSSRKTENIEYTLIPVKKQ